MKLFLLLLLIAVTTVNCVQKVAVSVDKNGASASGVSTQSAKGNKISAGGSASSSSDTDSNGDSSAKADTSGTGTESPSEGVTTEAPAETSTAAATEAATEASTEAATEASTEAATEASTEAAPVTLKPKPQILPKPKVNTKGAGAQVPGVWDALDGLRGKAALLTDPIQALLASAVPGKDYPTLAAVPDVKAFDCEKTHQAGFYADTDFQCQVIRRCDTNGILSSYLCPNQTLFNQITLVCDWFFNVDCANAKKYYDYSNSRLYQSDQVLLDTPAQ
jgi:hypothetical protein